MSKLRSGIIDYKEEKIKDKNRLLRRVENYKHDTSRKVNHGLNSLWKNVEAMLAKTFSNILPKVRKHCR